MATEDTNTWKLTLKDTSLSAGDVILEKFVDGDETGYVVHYKNATTGTDDEKGWKMYVSAVLLDNGGTSEDKTDDTYLGYMKLGDTSVDGTGSSAEFSLPEGVELGDRYSILVFSEKCGGTTATDYAGTMTEVTPVTLEKVEVAEQPTKTAYKVNEPFDPAGMVVTATFSDDSTWALLGGDKPEYSLNYESKYNNGFHIQGEPVEVSEAQTITATYRDKTTDGINVTVEGLPQDAPAPGMAQDATSKLWSITRLTDKMEYHVGNSGDWTTCPNGSLEVTSGEETTYQVRLKATGDYKAGDIATVKVPAKGATTYAVTIGYTLDGSEWDGKDDTNDTPRKIDLIGATYAYYDYDGSAIVMPDTYNVWAENDDGEMIDTKTDVTISSENKTHTVNYYTVTFDVNIEGVADIQPKLVSGAAYKPTSETAKAKEVDADYGLDFVKWTLDGAAAGESITVSAKDVTYLASYTVKAVEGKEGVGLSVKDIYGGETLQKPEDVELNVAGQTLKGAWTVDTGDIGTTTATQGTDYIYKATFTAPNGYTFDTSLAEEGVWTVTANGKTITRTFAAIKAGYPVTVSGITVGETVTYTVGEGAPITRPVTDGTVTVSVPAETSNKLAVTTTDSVTYSATVDKVAQLKLGETLVQDAPVITMDPTGTQVALDATAITLTFDQPVTKNANAQAIVRVYSNSPLDSSTYYDTYMGSYSALLSAITGSGTEYTLPLNKLYSNGTQLKLEKGLYYELTLPAGAFVSSNGLAAVATDKFTKYFGVERSGGWYFVLSTPENGTLTGADASGAEIASGTVKKVIPYNSTLTFTAVANSGYEFSHFLLVWSGVDSYDLTEDTTLPKAIAPWVQVTGQTIAITSAEKDNNPSTNAFKNFRLEAVFTLKTGATGGTSTGGSGGGGGGGGSQPTTPVTPVDPVDPTPSDLPFTDVPSTEWYVDAVTYVYENGLMNGTGEETFTPNGTTTRAMIWTVLGRLAGETIEGSTWDTDAQTWAVQAGVSDGTNPNDPVTREQLVTMLYRFVDTPEGTADLSTFVDGSAVSDYAQHAMAWAVSIGLLQGDDLGCLNPTATATRAEVATILMRFCEATV